MVWRTLPNIRLSSPGLTTYRIPNAKITDKDKMPNDIEQYFNVFFRNLFSPFTCPCLVCWRQVEEMRNLNKKSFYFVTLTPSQSGWKPLFIGGSVVRVRVRVWGQKWGKGRSIGNTTKKTKRFLVTKLWAPEQDDVTKKVYYRNVPLKVKISNDLFFHPNKILYLCGQNMTILSRKSLSI